MIRYYCTLDLAIIMNKPNKKVIQSEEIYEIYDRLNKHYFNGSLPYIRILWTNTFGHGEWFKQFGDFIALPGKKPFIRLSQKLCSDPKEIARVLYHEMVHFWLYVNKKPWGHTKEFKKKLKEFKLEV
ncbi:MAG: hypothetical protein A3B68_02920 [Candidatus Melainabacteria bacterium RIFCSPHIGHO2_02_FULL_34_12]|nr:MAG: hypothetical protein A3B68_02920 [Candidatus Melainabacteria bacterium RIFCSPHIGHO2_02_FULL_34_12]